jgi:D-alanyl-lipoteichoic acid acyltransferase DltB (MBOAT superfamily)
VYSLVDLFNIRFWLLVGAAFILLTPLTNLRLREWVFAGLNLLLIRLFFGVPLPLVVLVGSTIVLYVYLQHAARLSRWLPVVVALLFGIFLVHKLNLSDGATGPGKQLLGIIGYSYVFLRALDMVLAVARGHDPPRYAQMFNYLLPFHMLAAGPIRSFEEYAKDTELPPPATFDDGLAALDRIATGLFKKYVLAFCLDRVFLTEFHATGWYFFVEAQLYFLWLYLDFSAYSDIAVGIGRLIGVTTPENFNRPYLARNLIDFWERWHMTLSQWLRRSVFIPLQLVLLRRTPDRPLLTNSVALIVTFVICGLWHNLTIPFTLWGIAQAVGVVANNFYRTWLTKRLGKAGFKAYLNNRLIHAVAVLLTYEYVAFSTLIWAYPWYGGVK